MRALVKAMPVLLPLAVQWASQQERRILLNGVPLAEPHFADAQLMGVKYPEKIRLLRVDRIPLPASKLLRSAAKLTGLVSPDTAGMSLRYGIFLRSDWWGDRRIIAHECVHTAQYERFGGFHEFLKHYLRECLEVGYPSGPLEQEAIRRSERIVRRKGGA